MEVRLVHGQIGVQVQVGGVRSKATAFNSSTQGNNGESLNAFNTKNHCGYTDQHLPTTTNSGDYVVDLGGDWGAIGTYAINNNYVDQTNFGDWLNINNFINII